MSSCIGKELNFPHSLGDLARPSALPQPRDAAIDQRRTNRTTSIASQFVGRELEISRGECRANLHLKARTVAIVPRRRRMYFDVKWQFKLGCSSQALAQDFFLDFELMIRRWRAGSGIRRSGQNVRQSRLDAVRRSLDDGVGLRFGAKTRFLIDEGRLNFLHRSAQKGRIRLLAATVGFVLERIGRKTGESIVAAVDQLFDCEEQEKPILRHEGVKAPRRQFPDSRGKLIFESRYSESRWRGYTRHRIQAMLVGRCMRPLAVEISGRCMSGLDLQAFISSQTVNHLSGRVLWSHKSPLLARTSFPARQQSCREVICLRQSDQQLSY